MLSILFQLTVQKIHTSTSKIISLHSVKGFAKILTEMKPRDIKPKNKSQKSKDYSKQLIFKNIEADEKNY
jgi:hypothetical protein